jgi:hypothetical protein
MSRCIDESTAVVLGSAPKICAVELSNISVFTCTPAHVVLKAHQTKMMMIETKNMDNTTMVITTHFHGATSEENVYPQQ